MNVIITLPNRLIELIISGKKQFEMRRCMPRFMKIGEDGFFVVEKGTDNVRCWCRVDYIVGAVMTKELPYEYAENLGVTPEYILNYAPEDTLVYMWRIGKVITFKNLKRELLFINKNQLSFQYCFLSYGESF